MVSDIFQQHVVSYNLRNEKVWESGNLRTVMYGTETVTSEDLKLETRPSSY